LFVANEDVLDGVVVERVIEGESYAAGLAEDYIDAFALEAFEEDLGTAQERAARSGRRDGGCHGGVTSC